VLPIVFVIGAANPRPVLTVVGLVLMAAGESIRLWAAAYLGLTARASTPKSTKLVTRGPYALTRHPLYWGNFCLTLGFCLAAGSGFPWFPAVVAVGFVALYTSHARREERALADAFPDPYARYRHRVPALRWALRARSVPEVGNSDPPSMARALRVEALTLNAEFWLLLALWARVRWLGQWGFGQHGLGSG
jgi:protein-S-isoprenylcysteine O-methyltransferase Ste14